MTALTITIPGAAVGKGRPRFGNGRTYTDSKTLNAEAWIRQCAIDQVGQPVLDCPLRVDMRIDVAVPASWSKKKRQAALDGSLRATGRPDVDNISKAALDALNGIVWRDDAQVDELHIVRRYAEAPGICLTVMPA
ncbi:Holliday junction resolvase RusA [Gluconacetobacter johannae DSM 13595]|uniref:RusA family crossover junction endodeoxyribonuclease n=1 Tax=Gluconacetobacter johannae TaxID=112140 RepID=A0A7W4J8X2_9PROT|nr:RusA family crossover junction endodeoxyribonuclease [Gluconacetobacter johannae]MBB2176751.1 RusA family crossover junction endodeoxyribonuclease [Gluconacetobacter johannae]GBQ79513.1 Holliday junction resolvase RusA [Gluconacetobacter johannae DSM 13595]